MNDKKPILFIVITMSFIMPYMASSINVALPTLGNELQMSAVAMSWVATSYLLSNCVVLLSFGRLADIIGRRKIFLIGMIIYTIATLLCAFSSSSILLISFRVLQGIGSAMIFATSIAILTASFPREQRGMVMGYYTAAVYIGLSAGPFIGGILTQALGWRSVFYVTVPVGVIAIIFTILKMKVEWIEAKGETFDYIGAIIYGVSIFAFIYGITRVPSLLGIILIAIGIIGIIIFGIIESRIESPILNMSLFKKNRVFIFSSLAALINYSATFAISFLLGMYLQYIQGFTPQMAGVILIAQPIVQAIVSPYAGRLSDKTEPIKIASLGMAITTFALLMFSFLGNETHLLFIIASLAISGLGLGLFSSPNANAIMSSVDKKIYGVASSVLSTMRVIGQNMSLGISMVVFAILIGNAQIIPVNYPSFIVSVKTIFSILTGLCFVGIFLSLSRGNLYKTEN